MREKCLIAAFLISAGLATVAHAQIAREAFRWRAPLQPPLATGTLYRAQLDPAIFDGCRSFPTDMRLLDEDGKDWLFFPYTPEGAEPTVPVALKTLDPPADHELRGGIQTLFFDTGFRSQPLRRLTFAIETPQFTRPIKIFGRDSATNQWRWIADGALHRMDGQERNFVNLPNAGFRFLKVEVFNYEEPEIAVAHAEALAEPHYIIFLPAGEKRAWLYFGADLFTLPRFELRHSTSREQIANVIPASFDKRERNPYHINQEIWRYAKLLLIASLLIAAVLALGVISKRLRNG